MKITLGQAARATGHTRMTLERWIENGWLPAEEKPHRIGRTLLVDLDDIPAAQETATRALRWPVRVWLDMPGSVQRPIPRAGCWQHEWMRSWVRRNAGIFE